MVNLIQSNVKSIYYCLMIYVNEAFDTLLKVQSSNFATVIYKKALKSFSSSRNHRFRIYREANYSLIFGDFTSLISKQEEKQFFKLLETVNLVNNRKISWQTGYEIFVNVVCLLVSTLSSIIINQSAIHACDLKKKMKKNIQILSNFMRLFVTCGMV